MISRRALLTAIAACPGLARAAPIDYPPVSPRVLSFPRDHGAHPEFRVEWWYLTGWLEDAAPLGFQLTFFRLRPDIALTPSAFSARQLLIAHAALADPASGQLSIDEAIARSGFGAVAAAEEDTRLRLDRWQLERDPSSGAYRGRVPARGFALDFDARPTQPLLLQGQAGWSQKGPHPEQASYYYSQPQLEVQARLTRGGKTRQLRGRAWLDHEWSSSLLDARAAGWDWLGMNLVDGSALTAFQMRTRDDSSPLWTYAALRDAQGRTRQFSGSEVQFLPQRHWESPRTRTRWPVAWQVQIGTRRFVTRPIFDDQELDSRRSTGAVYWEGASEMLESGAVCGRGYVEMTGYLAPMKL